MKTGLDSLKNTLDALWDESKHPRSHGKFTSKGSESPDEAQKDAMGAGDYPHYQRITDDDRLALHNALQKANGEYTEAQQKLDAPENQNLGHRDAVYRLQRARAKVNHLTRMHKLIQETEAKGEVPRRYHLDWDASNNGGATFSDWIAGTRGNWRANSSGRTPTTTVSGKEFKTHSPTAAGVEAGKREFNAQLSEVMKKYKSE